MSTRQLGERVQRREDPRLLTGNGRYLDDLGHGALAAAFVRSPHAHARVVDVDIGDAWEVDGVEAIYTWDDLTGRVAEPLPVLIPHPALTHARTGHALARDEVNHVGEAVVMVVARDRYVAEDAARRIRVRYEQLPVVVGIEAARSGAALVHDDAPGNVSAHLLQEVGDLESAMAAAPNTLSLDLAIERSASTPLEGRGVYARWDTDDESLRLYSSTQTTTGVRAAVAAKLGMPLAKVECIAPDVGGGFGVKIMHPWPEEVLVPWAARNLGRDVTWTEDRREHFVSSAHERGQLQEVTVGFDDDGRILALDVRFWHDNGAYTPYGIIVPIITATQLLGPYKPGAYRVEFWSLYTNTVLVTPYRGAGRPQGCFAMERTMDAVAAHLGLDRAEVRVAQLHPARGDALRPGADVPGRAAAALRLGGLPGIPGQAQGARGLGRLRRLPRAGRARGAPRRPRHRVLRRGHRRRPLRGRARARRDERAGQRRHRPDDPGPGAPDDPRPDRRRRARGAARGRPRHHR